MHRTESRQHNNDFKFIGSANHPLHVFKLTNVSYSKDGIIKDQTAKQSIEKIKEFIGIIGVKLCQNVQKS